MMANQLLAKKVCWSWVVGRRRKDKGKDFRQPFCNICAYDSILYSGKQCFTVCEFESAEKFSQIIKFRAGEAGSQV